MIKKSIQEAYLQYHAHVLNWMTIVLEKEGKDKDKDKENHKEKELTDKVKEKEAKAAENLKKKEEYIDALLLSILNRDQTSKTYKKVGFSS